MFPLVEVPELVRHYAPFFQGVFSAEAFVKFERYISGLIVPLSTILFSIALHKTIAYSSSNLYNKPIKLDTEGFYGTVQTNPVC
jgi:hypothetical protein